MQNIVIPISAAPSQARAPDSGGSGGAEGAGGLFGLLMSAQLANENSSNGIGKKTAENCTDPLAALLVSALLQGSIFYQVNANTEVVTETNQQQQASTGPSATAGSAGSALSALMELAGGKGAAGIRQALAENPQFLSEWKALLMQASDGKGSGGKGSGGESSAGPAQLLNGQDRKALKEFLVQLAGGETVETATPAAQGGAQALEEIRRLFAALIEGEPAAQNVSAAAQTASAAAQEGAPEAGMPLQAAVQEQANPQPALNADIPRQAAAEPQPEGTTLPAAQAVQSNADQASAEGGQSQLAEAAQGDAAMADKPAKAESKKDPPDFSFVLKAAHGRETSSAVSHGAKADAPAAGTAQQAFDNIVDKITSMRTASQKEMEISLKPDFLGKVVIKLSMDEGGLVAKITASNPKVQDAFLNQAGALQNSLAEQGLKDVRIIVTSSSVPDASLQQQAERRGQERRDQGRRNAVIVDAAEGPAASAPLSAYEQIYHTGTINYLA